MKSPVHSAVARPALRIALIYAVIAGAWILGSDALLRSLLAESTIDRLTRMQTVKGLAFVATTAGLLFLLVRSSLAAIRESQKALVESEDRFRRLVDFAPSGILVYVDYRVVYANRAMLQMLGYSSIQDWQQSEHTAVIHPDDRAIAEERMRIIRETGRAVPLLEERWRRADGTYIWVEVAGQPFDFGGQRGSQAMVRDITARKLAEDQLKQLNETLEKRVAERTTQLQQANDDLRTFSDMISHDLPKPLRSVARFAEELLQTDSGRSDPAVQERARRIVGSVARLERLIQELFEYNRLARTELRPQRISLVLVVHDVLGQLSREPGFAAACIHVREPMPWVLAHRPTLVLVLQNLLDNAVKFAKPGTRPDVSISAEDRGSTARLSIEDNGVGIDPQRLDSIFRLLEQPRTDDAEYTGIGLAIVRRGVERMGGRVGVESTRGVGSRFWIELPKDPQSP